MIEGNWVWLMHRMMWQKISFSFLCHSSFLPSIGIASLDVSHMVAQSLKESESYMKLQWTHCMHIFPSSFQMAKIVMNLRDERHGVSWMMPVSHRTSNFFPFFLVSRWKRKFRCSPNHLKKKPLKNKIKWKC
jgi:hypothetical protein